MSGYPGDVSTPDSAGLGGDAASLAERIAKRLTEVWGLDDVDRKEVVAAVEYVLRSQPVADRTTETDQSAALTRDAGFAARADASSTSLADRGSDESADLSRCPTCGSRNPKMHPATQHEGEVIALCRDPWHSPTADEIEAKERARPAPSCAEAPADGIAPGLELLEAEHKKLGDSSALGPAIAALQARAAAPGVVVQPPKCGGWRADAVGGWWCGIHGGWLDAPKVDYEMSRCTKAQDAPAPPQSSPAQPRAGRANQTTTPNHPRGSE